MDAVTQAAPTVAKSVASTAIVWPTLAWYETLVIFTIPFLAWAAIYLVLRVFHPQPFHDIGERRQLLPGGGVAIKKVMKEGEQKGSWDDYDWTTGFDMYFLAFMVISFFGLALTTSLYMPELWSNGEFWLCQLPKLVCMMGVSIVGGVLCRYMCVVDDNGYIQTGEEAHRVMERRLGPAYVRPPKQKGLKFKVNYTRKLQHFAAYAVPLFIKSNVKGTLALCWGDWFTMLGFLVQIKPIREMKNWLGTFFMLQFNSLDRPEDRPDTMFLIIGGNILPGLIMIILFRYLYSFTNQQELTMIWILITGIGDGLAEPVGITWGTHKYECYSITLSGDSPKYTRSYEGSACVLICGMIFTSWYYAVFANGVQFWLSMLIVPPLLTLAEAFSPHTMDTPFMMGLGGLTLLAITNIF